MLEVDQLQSRYGRIPALAGVSLRVQAGELVASVEQESMVRVVATEGR